MKAFSATCRRACLALAFVCAVIGSTPAMAETTDFTGVESLIKSGDLDAAEQRIDAVLKVEPDNVNALMYKGNIIFYRNSNVMAAGQVYANEDESIYSTDMGSIGEGSALTTPEAARQVAVYFKRALAIAPERMDIQLGLCWTYANAGLKDELIARFPYLQKYGKGHGGLQYNMGDYARVILENYSFDDGIAVYREIARLYPDDGNLLNDIAVMYRNHRDLDTAMKYFDKVAAKKNLDEHTFGNLALFYAVNGEYGKGLAAQKEYSRLRHDDYWMLYDALSRRLRGDAHWQDEVQAFIRRHHGHEQDKDYVAFAKAVLPVNGKYPPGQLDKAKELNVGTYLLILDSAALVREFPGRFDAAFEMAYLMNIYSNYRRALQLYDDIERRKPPHTQEQVEAVRFEQAWALYASGQKEAANARWKQLLDSSSFYRKSAAAYFLADYAYDAKQYRQAADYCAKVKNDASQSKYATYCSNLYGRAKKKL